MDKTPRGAGGAWSGFTWEKNYYHDPVGFLKALHDRGLKTALNDHPNEGIRYFETKYKEVCEYMGRDPSAKLVSVILGPIVHGSLIPATADPI